MLTAVPAGRTRLLAVAVYTAVAKMSLGAIGLAFSTLTTHPIGAIAGLMVLVVASDARRQPGMRLAEGHVMTDT